MLTAQLLLTGNQIQRRKTGRKPLQPWISPANLPSNNNVKPKKKPEWIEIPLVDNSNKENPHHCHIHQIPTEMEPIDPSLAEELSAIRQKLERLRLDRDKTEKMLRERDLALERNMKDLVNRAEAQKQLEIEVDRLFRLKELKSLCERKSPRSLREKEQGRKIKDGQPQGTNSEGTTGLV